MIQPVLIIGGGLAGITAARALGRAGVAFQLIEARARLGGRILAVHGMPDLATRLAADLPDHSVLLNARATALILCQNGVTVKIDGGHDLLASHVLLALPPRLAASSIAFEPLLPPAVLNLWRGTPTWMAPHAKVVAVYDRPFWRAAGLSGAALSQVGPLVEIHDANTAKGSSALFGFVGVSAQERARAGQAALIAAALRQLGMLFGAAAAEPAATHYKEWAADPLTATPLDLADGTHPTPVRLPWIEGDWTGRLDLIGSETSIDFPGYLAGAHEAALRGTTALVARLDHPQARGMRPAPERRS